jgi:4,5-DOPA dioxygenase extradiol
MVLNRKKFIKNSLGLSLFPIIGSAMKIHDITTLKHQLPPTPKMPVLFLGHGSPMNAIEENEFVAGFRTIAKEIPTPKVILCISAHWETKGTFVTSMPQPKTIHDFGGFPQELFDVQYPAPGSPEWALETQKQIQKTQVQFDENWGLDHGSWSVIKHLYPLANIPVIQLSLDYTQGPQYHYELAKELAALRDRGVLIIGSGNMVHNLSKVAWRRLNETFAFDWALEAQTKMNAFIDAQNHDPLIRYRTLGTAFEWAIPSPEHYLPLLYTLALQGPKETVLRFNDKPVAGALTMTSLKIG